MKIHRVNKYGIVAILMALVLLISACATMPEPQSDAGSDTATDSPTEQSEATAEPAEEAADEAASEETASEEAAGDAEEMAAPMMTKLNLNTVTGDELLSTIPDFGNRMVREFEEYRPYISIQQFRREIGKYVDEAQVAEYEQYVYVPVSVNDSDAETLMQIPGVDNAIAETLMANRPYESNDAFLTSLAESISAENVDVAKAYLETE